MPVLILELRFALAIVNPAAIGVSHEEDPMMHVIRDSRKMHIVEAAGRFIAEDEVEIPAKHILWGCRSNFSFESHPFERVRFENGQRGRPANGAGWFTRFLKNQLAIGDCPGTGTI
jgi:hypothetical protein